MKLNFSLPGNDMAQAGMASSSLKKKLLQLGVNPAAVKRAVIALYEAEINMVIHGGGGEVEIEITTESISAVISDKGPGIEDIELAMMEGYSTASDSIREMGFGAGMGLPNIRKNADFFNLKSSPGEGTVVTINVNF